MPTSQPASLRCCRLVPSCKNRCTALWPAWLDTSGDVHALAALQCAVCGIVRCEQRLIQHQELDHRPGAVSAVQGGWGRGCLPAQALAVCDQPRCGSAPALSDHSQPGISCNPYMHTCLLLCVPGPQLAGLGGGRQSIAKHVLPACPHLQWPAGILPHRQPRHNSVRFPSRRTMAAV